MLKAVVEERGIAPEKIQGGINVESVDRSHPERKELLLTNLSKT